MNQVRKNRDAILFIDEIHTLIGAGSASGGTMDASNLLKPALSWRVSSALARPPTGIPRYFREGSRTFRRFQKIDVSEHFLLPDTVEILKGFENLF